MVAIAKTGVHTKNPWELMPYVCVATDLTSYDATDTSNTSATTAFFTEMARRGLQNQTDWSANTYKTLLSVSSGNGFVAAVIGCTAGGTETTTFEFTVDGVLSTVSVGPLASGSRGAILAHAGIITDFTTANKWYQGAQEALNGDVATFGAITSTSSMAHWREMVNFPLLRFDNSLLIRAKHSASITNSTATSYSAVMYRLGIAS